MQSSFSALFFKEKVTRTQKFLTEMQGILPWHLLLAPLRDWKTAETGRKGFSSETMLRMWLLQNWYGLSDEMIATDVIQFNKSYNGLMKSDGMMTQDDVTKISKADW